MPKGRVLSLGALFGIVLVAHGIDFISAEAQDSPSELAPMFEVDPFWPQPLPNNWLMGPVIGADVDSQDNIWILHRSTPDSFQDATEVGMVIAPPASECCQPAPPVLVFNQAGDLIDSWGAPGTETGDDVWPESSHGITVDHMDNVWIGGNGQGDAHVLKFTRNGEFLLQAGRHNARMVREEDGRRIFERDSLSEDSYGRVAKIGIDPEANEAYFADGYLNKRIAVVDVSTGEFKRAWGAYGNVPDDDYDFGGQYEPGNDPAQQFRGPVRCAEISNDGLVYVCDATENRIQVFQKDGTFVDEAFIRTETLGAGSVGDIAFSPDREQTFAYVADGTNQRVHVLRRESLNYIYSFGYGGRQPGMFYHTHSITVDSSGNIYTTETNPANRVQKFAYVRTDNARDDIGVTWPRALPGGTAMIARGPVDLLVVSELSEARITLSPIYGRRPPIAFPTNTRITDIDPGDWKYTVSKSHHKSYSDRLAIGDNPTILTCVLRHDDDAEESICY